MNKVINASTIKIELTGNPFVDTGLATIAILADLDDVQDLTLDHIRNIHGDGKRLASWNQRLSSFSQIFGTNNPLFQNGYGYKKGIGPSKDNIAIYCATLQGFLDNIQETSEGPRCESCGSPTNFDFAAVCIAAVEASGKNAPEDKWIGRDWFPLAGSLGSDAQALPAASRSVHLCAKCLFAIHYLPLSLLLLDGRLSVFQSTSIEMWYELVRDIVGEIQARIRAGNFNTLGAKEGSRAVITRLLDFIGRLRETNRLSIITPGTTLNVWRFTNSGSSPDCIIEEIPNPVLLFLADAIDHGLRLEIQKLIESEGKKERPFFHCINARQDYAGLYPRGKRTGASPRLFTLYQTKICGHTSRTLSAACMLAKKVIESSDSKTVERIRREEAFSEPTNRSLVRGVMIELARSHKFSLNDYYGLFPLNESTAGIAVSFGGWKLIRYCLYHPTEIEPFIDSSKDSPSESIKMREILYYSTHFYMEYVKEHPELLNRMARGGVGTGWLKGQFIRLAETYSGFTYGAWEDLCTNNNSRVFIFELLFEMRLLWTEWQHMTKLPAVSIPHSNEYTGLPAKVEDGLRQIFLDYVDRRGLDRFHRDILMRLRRRDIGLEWFRNQLVYVDDELEASSYKLSYDEWEYFIRNEDGQSWEVERLFQMHLVLANLYKTAK